MWGALRLFVWKALLKRLDVTKAEGLGDGVLLALMSRSGCNEPDRRVVLLFETAQVIGLCVELPLSFEG